MKDIEHITSVAASALVQRNRLKEEIRKIENKYKLERDRISAEYTKWCKSAKEDSDNRTREIKDKAEKDRSCYLRRKKELSECKKTVKVFLKNFSEMDYDPAPEGISEKELNNLLEMIRAEGFIVWLQRIFKLNGFDSKRKLAQSVMQKVINAEEYCNERLDEIESKKEIDLKTEAKNYEQEKERKEDDYNKEIDLKNKREEVERKEKKQELSSFYVSKELIQLRQEITRNQELVLQKYLRWDQYIPPKYMPDDLFVGNIAVKILEQDGNVKDESFPLKLPLNQTNILVISSKNGDIADVDSDLRKRIGRQIIARMLMTIPATNNRISIFDTLHKGGSLGRLIALSDIGNSDLNVNVYGTEDECEKRRIFLGAQIQKILTLLAGKYNLFRYKAEHTETSIPFNWIMDFSFSNKPNSKTEKEYLELLTNASNCGFSFIFVTSEEGFQNLYNLSIKAGINKNIVHIDVDAMECRVNGIVYPLQQCITPDETQIDNYMNAISKYYETASMLDNSIFTYYNTNPHKLQDATNGIRIPIAIDNYGKSVYLELFDEQGVHCFVTGSTRSGKSTFLHTVIMGAILLYSPDDLELWLVDYKRVEFATYRKSTPPHIKLIGLSKSKEFTYSLLDSLHEEFNRRAEVFTRFNAVSLAQYRRHKGEEGYVNFPRILLIIDEFHELSQFVQDDTEYMIKLENVLAEYGSLGLNCLLSDQAISVGLRGLTPKAKNQILSRMAMKNQNISEIRETLGGDPALYSEGVKKMLHKLKIGDIVMLHSSYKDEEASDITIEKFRVLYSTSEDRAALFPVVNKAYMGKCSKKQMIYINSTEQEVWNEADRIACDQSAPLRPGDVRLYLGRTVTLKPSYYIDLHKKANENILIVGGEAEKRWDIIAAVINSCKYIKNVAIDIFVAQDSDLDIKMGGRIEEKCKEAGAVIRRTAERWCERILELYNAVKERKNIGNTICVFAGMEVMRLEMEQYATHTAVNNSPLGIDFSSPFAIKESNSIMETETDECFNCIPMIETIFKFGSRLGVSCIAEISVYRELRSFRWIEDTCVHKIALKMSGDDAVSYLGRSSYADQIGDFAVCYNGGVRVEQLIPYKDK